MQSSSTSAHSGDHNVLSIDIYFSFFFDPPQRPAQLNFFQIFFLKNMVRYTFQMILSRFEQKDIFRFFEIFLGPDTLDFDSFWRPHRAFNRYNL